MINRILTGFYALLILIGVAAQPALAADEKKKEEPKSEKKAEKAEAASETVAEGTEKVEVSKAFLNRWKNIQKATSQKAYETQQTRTVAGVRGAEAEDRVLDQLYYKGGVRYHPSADLDDPNWRRVDVCLNGYFYTSILG